MILIIVFVVGIIMHEFFSVFVFFCYVNNLVAGMKCYIKLDDHDKSKVICVLIVAKNIKCSGHSWI